MNADAERLAAEIHAGPTQLVLAASGGGAGAIANLLGVAGASRSILEAVVPYSQAAMLAWLGGKPDQFCSERTARAMAMAAFRRARQYAAAGTDVAGVACTSSLATDRPKAGPHRVHVALQTADRTAFWSVELVKGRRSRQQEEDVADRLLLNAAAEACDAAARVSACLAEGEDLVGQSALAEPAWRALLLAETDLVCEGPPAPRPRSDTAKAIFPGEFNPLHDGHRRMAAVAEEILGIPVECEISIVNVEKPPLDYFEIRRRVAQFAGRTVWLSRAARFSEKCRLFPAATFVVGVDTIRRIASPQYYQDEAARNAAAEAIAARGCRFLVFGRNLGAGFVSLGDLELPPKLAAICRAVPAEKFREDVSSTSIRRGGQWP